jgi:hypothetical protein
MCARTPPEQEPWRACHRIRGRPCARFAPAACQNGRVVNKSKKPYVDNGWPQVADGEHAVTELSSSRSGNLSPFGEDTEFPVAADQLPYVHPHTVINR